MILITGASGFLGGHVVRELRGEGRNLIASGRNVETLSTFNVATVVGDLSDRAFLDNAERLQDVEAIIHCAALSSPWGREVDFERANVRVTQNLLTLAKRIGVSRFVHISTPSVYFRFEDQIGVGENQTLPPPVNAYARTKVEAEKLVLAEPDLGPIVLRPRGIYGQGDNALLPRMLDRVSKGPLPLFRNGVAKTDLTHVDDVVSAIRLAVDAPAALNGEIFNISGGEPLPLKDIIEDAAKANGLEPRWRSLPVKPALQVTGLLEKIYGVLPGRPEPPVTRYGIGLLAYSQTLNISKARDLMGWTPQVQFKEGLRRTFTAGQVS